MDKIALSVIKFHEFSGAGTLLGATPTPRPPPRPKHAASKIPTKAGRTVEEAVPGTLLVDLEEASNVCSDNEEVKKIPAPTFAKVNNR